MNKKVKSFFALLLCLMIILSLASCSRSKSGKLEFKLNQETDTYTLSYYTDTTTVDTLVIPEEFEGKKVTKIGAHSISNADSLKTLVISKNITEIEEWGITNCRQLEKILVDDENPNYCSIDDVLFSKDKQILISYPNAHTAKYSKGGKLETKANYTVPNGVVTIGHCAFYKCYGLEMVTLPGTVKTIGAFAFQKANNMTTINIQEGLISIEADAFHGCEGLEKIYLPASLEKIGAYVFYNALNLQEVYVGAPESQLELGEKWYPSTAGKSINAKLEFGYTQ